MKVLILAHNREDSGWGRACRDFIKAVASQVEVVVRPVILGQNYVDPEIEKLEMGRLNNITHCIQYLLPHYMSYHGGFDKIVGVSLIETVDLEHTKIPHYLKLTNELWDVGNCYYIQDHIVKETKQAFEYSDTSKQIQIPEIHGTYKFYCIAEGIKRKNLQNIIKGFFSEFEHEPVSLVLKTSIPGQTPEVSLNQISNMIAEIKAGCRMYAKDNYPKIEVITNKLSNDEIKALHKYCDCYIDFSYGEAINYGMLEAAYFGNDIISTTSNKYAKHLNLSKVCGTIPEPCYGQVYTFPGYNTSREFWNSPLIIDLMKYMRDSYNLKKKYKYNMDQFSYEQMGKEYLELLVY